MKTSNISKIVLTIAFLALFSATADAQFRVRPNDKLTIGPVEPHLFYGQTIFGNGMYFIGRNRVNFFQIDVTPANPRLAGTGNQVVFFNTATSTFNSIQVRSVFQQSDARAKTNIRSMTPASGLDIVSQLRPVTYNFTGEVSRGRANVEEIGLIAQEVKAVLPGIVIEDEETGTYLINYTALIPVLIQAIQSLQSEVEALRGNQLIRQ